MSTFFKHIEMQIKKCFPNDKKITKKNRIVYPEENGNLSFFGYPNIFSITIPVTDIVLSKLMNEQKIFFPKYCCACFQEMSTELPIVEYQGLWGWKKIGRLGECVPHCENHANKAQLAITIDKIGSTVESIYINLIGKNQKFLKETLQLNSVGDVFPPWEVFPEYDSISGAWRQGNGEHYMCNIWLPYIEKLEENQRIDYLSKWSIPPDWVEFLKITKTIVARQNKESDKIDEGNITSPARYYPRS